MPQAKPSFSPLETHGERLREVGRNVAITRQAYEDALALRDRAVIEAKDCGLSYAQVAKLAEMSPARVVQILAKAS